MTECSGRIATDFITLRTLSHRAEYESFPQNETTREIRRDGRVSVITESKSRDSSRSSALYNRENFIRLEVPDCRKKREESQRPAASGKFEKAEDGVTRFSAGPLARRNFNRDHYTSAPRYT